jgi:hypothetical protein
MYTFHHRNAAGFDRPLATAWILRRRPGHIHTMTRSAPLGLVLSFALTSAALAGVSDVSPELRQRAVDTCSGDAMRLCPMAMSDEASAVSCMAGKRPQLTLSCRVVYDQVARVLKQ